MAIPAAALVREVPDRLAEGELTHLERQPVDVERARAQHAGYVALLRRLGLDIAWAPPAPEHPDGVFVEDAAVVVDGLAVLTRPGARSRRGEPAGLAAPLARHGLSVAALRSPGTLDGGDVLQLDDTVYVGRSARTDDAGIEQLRELLAPLGREIVPVELDGVLHLKTAVTALPDKRLVAQPGRVDRAVFADREILDVPEPAGADVLLVGDVVIVSGSAPETASLLRTCGYRVEVVDISEFEKLEAGPTCLSVLLPPVGGAGAIP